MKIILSIFRFFLGLRYKVKIKGTETLKHDGPILLLPNHVALVDPQILISFLYKYLEVSPVASEKFYNKPILKQIMDSVGTVPIGDFEVGSDAEKIKEVFGHIVDGLKDGKNILIYPSGQIYRQGFESIIGKQSVYNVAKLMPENTKVIGIRDTGLWGSMWSMAWDNGKTGFGMLALKSIYLVFINLRFFVPKRNILIQLEDITDQIKLYKNMSLGEFNKYLESFYNVDGEEKINYIKHYFFYDDIKDKKEPELISGSLKELNNIKSHDLSEIDNKVRKKVIEKIALIKEIKSDTINNDSKLILDLYFDSLDLSEIKSYIQANFEGASNPPINDLKTVGDLLIMAVGQSENVEELKECNWQNNECSGDLVDKIR